MNNDRILVINLVKISKDCALSCFFKVLIVSVSSYNITFLTFLIACQIKRDCCSACKATEGGGGGENKGTKGKSSCKVGGTEQTLSSTKYESKIE